MGETPYPGMKRQQLCTFIKSKSVMSQPDECPTSIYNIMRQCWEYSQSDRPNFGQIKEMLERALAEKQQVNNYSTLSIDALLYYGSMVKGKGEGSNEG